MNKNIFRAYDIRGIYPSELNQETAYKIGVALANKISGNRTAIMNRKQDINTFFHCNLSFFFPCTTHSQCLF